MTAGLGEANFPDKFHQYIAALRYDCAKSNWHEHEGCTCSDETLLKRAAYHPSDARDIVELLLSRRVKEKEYGRNGWYDTWGQDPLCREAADALAAFRAELDAVKREHRPSEWDALIARAEAAEAEIARLKGEKK